LNRNAEAFSFLQVMSATIVKTSEADEANGNRVVENLMINDHQSFFCGGIFLKGE